MSSGSLQASVLPIGRSPLEYGCGVLQVDKALDYLTSFSHLPAVNVGFKVKTSYLGTTGRGVYLREPHQLLDATVSTLVTCKPRCSSHCVFQSAVCLGVVLRQAGQVHVPVNEPMWRTRPARLTHAPSFCCRHAPVTPRFRDEDTSEARIAFELQLSLVSTASWVTVPTYFHLTSSSRACRILVSLQAPTLDRFPPGK
jgi:hypothetical protein